MVLMNILMILQTVPATGLTKNMHILVLGFLFPIIGSIITSLLFPRLFAPLFLEAKRKILKKKYKDSYIAIKPHPFKLTTLIKRFIYILAIAMAFLTLLVNVLNPELWLDANTLQSYKDTSRDPKYAFEFLVALMGIGLPIGVGIWAIAWAIEDSGLIHYVFKDDGYYEIEPVHIRFTSYVKGFASLASIIFLAQFFIYHLTSSVGDLADSMLVIPLILAIDLCFIPAYIIYVKVMGSHAYLRKDLEEIKILKEEDIKK